MTPENFCYWLQGFIETSNPKSIDDIQTKIIKDHLQLVFNKTTPKYYTDDKWKAQIVNMQHLNDVKEYNYTPIVDIKTMESC